MSKDIVWITMHYDNLKYLSKIFIEHGYDICVRYSSIEDFFNTVHEVIRNETKVIIVRGGIATSLKQQISIPVVDLKTTYIDYYETLDKAFRIADRVAFVGWYQHVRNFNRILKESGERIFYVELEPYSSTRDGNYIKEILLNVQSKGYSVVVGGGAVVEQARKIGMTALYVGLEKEAVLEAAAEAVHLLKVVNEQKSRQDIISSIFNCVSDGIVAVDTRGFVTNMNQMAKHILNLSDDVCRYKRFSEIISFPKLEVTYQKGTRLTNQVTTNVRAGSSALVISSEPIIMDNKLLGAVYTIQNAEAIHTANKKIKASNIERGLYAKYNFDHIIGSSEVINQLKAKAAKYAETDAPILITGESGTGKELFAHSIHNESARRGSPFVALNCASIPESLLGSELFGYVKGSFTGARSEGREGVFECANQGTVFLDEIGETSLNVQAHLLRVLQEKEIMRIGDNKVIPVDVRIISASNVDLEEAVRKGRFRKDLYYRLCVLPLNIVPIRERGRDSFEIIQYLLRVKYGRCIVFSQEAEAMLIEYTWPGNVREIFNFVERINALISDSYMNVEETKELLFSKNSRTPPQVSTSTILSADEPADLRNFRTSRDLTADEIMNALHRNSGSKKLTAQELGISTTTLWRKIKYFQTHK